MLGHPATGSPNANVLIIITSIIINEIIQKSIPTIDAIAKGAVEKATILSSEYPNNFQNDHFVVPATLSTFSYSNHFVS